MSVGFSDSEWLSSPDPRYPQYPTNKDRIVAEMIFRAERTTQPRFKTLFGQAMAVKTHHVSSSRLKQLGMDIPDVVAMTGVEDKIMDPKCTLDLGKHIGCRAVLFEKKGHMIVSEAEFETLLELEHNFYSAEMRWRSSN